MKRTQAESGPADGNGVSTLTNVEQILGEGESAAILSGAYEEKEPSHDWFVSQMSATYRQQWGVREALREIVQNALDEADLTGTKRPVFAADTVGRVLIVKDFGRGWSFDDFQRLGQPETKDAKGGNYIVRADFTKPGMNDKGPRSPRGAHGEGGKMALVRFLDRGHYVEVRSSKVWVVPFFTKRNVLREPTSTRQLAFMYDREGVIDQGTEVLIAFTNEKDFQDALSFLSTDVLWPGKPGINIINTNWNGEMFQYQTKGPTNGFFSRDLFVRFHEADSALFSYNIFSVPLNTDRTGFLSGYSTKGLVPNHEGYYNGDNSAKIAAGTLVLSLDPKYQVSFLQHLHDTGGLFEGDLPVAQHIEVNQTMKARWKTSFLIAFSEKAVLITDPTGRSADSVGYAGYVPIILPDQWRGFMTKCGVPLDTSVLTKNTTTLTEISHFFPGYKDSVVGMFDDIQTEVNKVLAQPLWTFSTEMQTQFLAPAIRAYVADEIEKNQFDGSAVMIRDALTEKIPLAQLKEYSWSPISWAYDYSEPETFAAKTSIQVFLNNTNMTSTNMTRSDDYLRFKLVAETAGFEVQEDKKRTIYIHYFPYLSVFNRSPGGTPEDWYEARTTDEGLFNDIEYLTKLGFGISWEMPPGFEEIEVLCKGLNLDIEYIHHPIWPAMVKEIVGEVRKITSTKIEKPKTAGGIHLNPSFLAMVFDAANVYHQITARLGNAFNWVTNDYHLYVYDLFYDSEGRAKPETLGYRQGDTIAFKRASLMRGFPGTLEIVFHEFTHAWTNLKDSDGQFGVKLGQIWETFLQMYSRGELHSRFLPSPGSPDAERMMRLFVGSPSILVSKSHLEE